MKVGILSDIHDNIWKLEAALERLAGAEVLLCCGDLCSPFVMDQLGRGFSGPLHVVWGNNDGDRYRLTLKAAAYPHVQVHGETAELELGGKSIAVHHFDDVARRLAASQQFDLVCFGHNHRYEVTREGRSLLINPGEIMGGLSQPRQSTFVVYDTGTGEAERHEV